MRNLSSPNVASLKWGKDDEKRAIECFEQTVLENELDGSYEMYFPGTRLCERLPFIGASPDGLYNCDCHNDGEIAIEVKCPYSKRDTKSLEEAVADENFYLDSNFVLKRTSQYFTQVQMQLFVLDLHKCTFIVWTPNWFHHQTILRDDYFIESSIPVLNLFFKRHIIPELVSRKLETITNNVEKNIDKVYCICRSVYDENENWIGCNSKECKSMLCQLCQCKKTPKRKLVLSVLPQVDATKVEEEITNNILCLLYTSPSPRDS